MVSDRSLLRPYGLSVVLVVAGLVLSVSPVVADDALTDMTGAACRVEPRADIAPDPGAPPPQYVYCGTKSHASGAVGAIVMPLSLPAEAAGRHEAMEKTAAAAPAGRDAAVRMTCRAGVWTTTADGLDVLVKPCALNDGQWPQLVMVAGVGNYLWQAEGMPATLPVLESLMAQASDYRPAEGGVPFGGAEKARPLLDQAFGGQLRLVGGADFERYNELTEAARLNNSRRDYRGAEEAYRAAMNIQERAFGSDSPGMGKALMELALEVSNQGRFDESAALFRRADPIVQRSPNPADQARYFTYMAYDAANGGRFADGLSYAREAVGIWRDLAGSEAPSLEELSGGNDAHSAMRGELAHSLTLEAAMARRVGELASAEGAAKEALDIIGEEQGLPPWWRPEVLLTIGEVYADEQRYREAEESFRGALIYQQRLFGDSLPTASTLLLLGRIYAEEAVWADSVRAYEFAFNILEKDEFGRSPILFDQIAPLFEAATALAGRAPEQRAKLEGTMFRALQMVSGGVADQTIAQATARLAAGNAEMGNLVSQMEEADRKRDEARMALAHETALPDEQRGSTRESALLVEINTYHMLREALLAKIEKDFPDYARLAHPQKLELADVQKRLAANEALVVFLGGREHVSAVVIRADRFVARPVALDQAKLAAAVRGLRKAFAARRSGLEEFDLREAHDLYRALFGPVEEALVGIDHLIVVPGGALASLPPALLVTQRPEGQDYRRAAWLVRRFATSQVPSVAAFVALRERAKGEHAGKPFIGFGNPLFSGPPAAGQEAKQSALEALGSQCREGGPVAPELLRALAPLPDTAGEVRTVAQALGAPADAVHLGAEASETVLRRQTLSDYRVIYFATHGLLPGELACQSEPALALSPPAAPAAGRDDDGLLEASEIAGLRLNADLVVLSACNTAQSPTRFGGEALSGLAESFFYAGARALIASHWQVPSAATASLMVGLFKRLGAASGTADALRQSQLALIDQPATAHPFFWAAFTVIGDGGRGKTEQAAGDVR
jgi:CHAT domain-containing protein